MTVTVPWEDRLELGEGPRWTGGRLVLVDILAGRLLEAPAAGGTLRELLRVEGPLGAVAPLSGAPGWIAAAGTGIALLGPVPPAFAGLAPTPDGTRTPLADPEAGAAVPARMNDGTADPHGRFWAGSMAWDTTPGAGSLYRVDPDGTVDRVLGGLTIPNGPVFDASGTVMYLADSARGVILRYPVDPVTGTPGGPAEFARPGSGSPDGMAVDAAGGVWSAVWGTGTVHRYAPDGTLDRVLELPAAQPAGVCLGGDDGRTLFVTSASVGLERPGPLDGAVFAVRVDVPGTPAACFGPGPSR